MSLFSDILLNPGECTKLTIRELQEIFSDIGLRKGKVKQEYCDRLIRFLKDAPLYEDLSHDLLLEWISKTHKMSYSKLKNFTSKELYTLFHTPHKRSRSRSRSPTPGKRRQRSLSERMRELALDKYPSKEELKLRKEIDCKKHLDNLQTIAEEPGRPTPVKLEAEQDFVEYTRKKCGTEPVLFDVIVLHSLSSTSDGNCFFDSLRTLLDNPESMKEFRGKLSNLFTLEDYCNINNGMQALSHLEGLIVNPDRIVSGEQLWNIVRGNKEMQNKLQADYLKHKSDIAKLKVWAEDWTVGFVSRAMQINILVYENRARQWQIFTPIMHYKPYIFLYNFSQRHFEPLVSNTNQKTFSEEQLTDGLRYLSDE